MAKPRIKICMGSSCFARGNEKNVDVIEHFLSEHNLKDDVDVELEACLCLGRCAEGAIVIIDDHVYTHVTAATMQELLEQLLPTIGKHDAEA